MSARQTRNRRVPISILAPALFAWGCASEPPPPPIEPILKDVPSPGFTVDRIFKSDLGPEANASGTFFPEEDDGLIWITGFRSTALDAQGGPLPQELLCHANLRYGDENEQLRKTTHGHNRIFTISQGQYAMQFDDGFGIPSRANRLFTIDNNNSAVTVPLPNNSGLVGVEIYAQSFWFDLPQLIAGNIFGNVRGSNAVRIKIGNF